MTLDANKLLRDTLITLAGLLVVAYALGGVSWAMGAAAGGALAALNVFLLGRLVGNLGADNAGQLMLGLLIKSAIGLAVLFALFQFFAPMGVMIGIGAAVVALTLRSAAGAFAPASAPQET